MVPWLWFLTRTADCRIFQNKKAPDIIKQIFKDLKERVLREEVLTHGVRLDGRKFDEVRAIWIETGVLPRTHGSAVFTRGETQALVTCTLGTAEDAQKVEGFEGEQWKSFMLHYNFPPFSVGEVAFLRGPGRREVGHGALAERSLTPILPAEEQFHRWREQVPAFPMRRRPVAA